MQIKRKLHTLLVGMQISKPLWKTVWRYLQKPKIELPYDPAVLLLGIHQKEYKSGHNEDTCTLMFTVALFTIARLWKQPRCPTTDEWIKKMYSTIRKNETMRSEGKWMQLEDIM
jgi:hypothetical protein